MGGEPNLYQDADLDEILADKDKRIAELEAFLQSLRSDLDIEHGRARVDVNWPKFKTLLDNQVT